jgi:hypothetical protein
MFNVLRTSLIAATLIAGAAHAEDRQITINADTKWVNVDNGDSVTFNVQGKSFTWQANTLHQEEALDLAKIAPAGVDAGKVTVYVASNPLYRG